MALDPEFLDAIVRLGRVFDRHRRETGHRPVLVGGAAVSILTDGLILSGDFDFVVPFDTAMREAGFKREHRRGHMIVGWYHPSLPRYGFQAVSGPLFDGRADQDRLLVASFDAASEVCMPGFEDMIADRLGQYASSGKKNSEMLAQAVLLFRLGASIDHAYLYRRVVEETGDPSDIGLMP